MNTLREFLRPQHVAIIIGIVVISFLIGSRVTSPTQSVPTVVHENGITVHVISIRDTGSSSLYRVLGEYPQFGDGSSTLNSAITNYIGSNLAQFKNDSVANQRARAATAPSGSKADSLPAQSFYFSVHWEPQQINDRFVSVIVRIEYYNGGANETQLLKTFNYDVLKAKMMTLGDLFPMVPTYLKQIAVLAQQELTSSLADASNGDPALDMIKEGTAPTAANYANFTFGDDVVNIYFPKYQVAPGVFGEQKVTIARSTIQ